MHVSHRTNYQHIQSLSDDQILEAAAEIMANRFKREDVFTSAEATKEFLQFKLGGNEREVFAVMLLDSQHQLIAFKELFWGTVNAASVYPREVVKAVLTSNAAAVIFAHNHPSGVPTPSQADISLTNKLLNALSLIDVSVLDHVIVGKTAVSFAERGLL